MSQENVEIMEGLLAGVAGLERDALLAALPEVIAQTCTSARRQRSQMIRGALAARTGVGGGL